ncbi:MAG TPA: hypothetical protein VF407_16620 [Polyangiaceae bacterium]
MTRGVALVGIGATTLACQREPHGMNGPEPVYTNGPEPVHTNAPFVPVDAGPSPSSSADPIGAPTASATAPLGARGMNGPSVTPSASHGNTPPRSTP